MLKTYTLYFRGEGAGDPTFEPVMCHSDFDAVRHAQNALASRPGCERVDVFFGPDELFQILSSD